ncbi:hypothetical protein [Nocardioides daejeonensis]|uniref:hypothetical protein n=1 Tax=Nocardioides daejeonensis TaxID=1046556 RepID=UPI0013A5A9D8|nr:hypothetical protein [Nocardioides daejeonensis]
MTARTRMLTGLIVLALVGAGFALWLTSADQRRHRLIGDLLDEPGVIDTISLERDGIREVVFSDGARTTEIEAAWERLEEERISRVRVGEVRVDPYDLVVAAPVALAAADLHIEPAQLSVREVGEDEVWLEAGFPPVPDGMAEPTPADGAAAVLAVLEELDPAKLPEHLFLVAAHRITQQLDLVVVEQSALARLPETIVDLRRVAASDPTERIACDAQGCRAG